MPEEILTIADNTSTSIVTCKMFSKQLINLKKDKISNKYKINLDKKSKKSFLFYLKIRNIFLNFWCSNLLFVE